MAGKSQLIYPLTQQTLTPDALTADSFCMLPFVVGQALEITIYVSFLTGVTSGVVKVESSYSPSYAGTWPVEATVTFTGTAPNLQVVHLTALNQAMRCRISTTIAGGSDPKVQIFAMAANQS